MKRLVAAALVLTLAVAAFSIGGSLALFTDTASVPGNSFTTAASFGLVSNGLVDRYFIEEAASGQSPTELVDAAPSPLNLPIIYDGTNPTYKEISTGRGWESTTTTNQGRASILVDGTKVQTLLDGSTQGTIEVVLQVDAVTTLCSRLSHVGASSESGYFTLSSCNLNQVNLYMFGNTLRGQWNPAFGTSGRIVLTLVYDSTLSTAADRVKLYKDGALLTKTGGTDPPQNETISIPNGTNFVVANRELCCRSFDGDIYYAAHYNAALTAANVSDNSIILLTNDDSGVLNPPGVSLANAWTTGLTHTVSAGSNRLLVFIAGMENGMAGASPPAGDRDLTAVTYGGQSLTPAADVVVCSGSPNSFCIRTELWYLDEAGIQAATGSTFSPTWSGDPPFELEEHYTVVTLENVDQSSPIGNSSTNGTTTANPIQTSSALVVGVGDLVVVSAAAGTAGSYTPGSGYTEGTDQSALSSTMASAYKTIAAGGTEQPSMQYDLTINRQVILAAVIKVAP